MPGLGARKFLALLASLFQQIGIVAFCCLQVVDGIIYQIRSVAVSK